MLVNSETQKFGCLLECIEQKDIHYTTEVKDCKPALRDMLGMLAEWMDI